jgi:hypothetical protein
MKDKEVAEDFKESEFDRKYSSRFPPLPILVRSTEDFSFTPDVTRKAKQRYLGNSTALPNGFSD